LQHVKDPSIDVEVAISGKITGQFSPTQFHLSPLGSLTLLLTWGYLVANKPTRLQYICGISHRPYRRRRRRRLVDTNCGYKIPRLVFSVIHSLRSTHQSIGEESEYSIRKTIWVIITVWTSVHIRNKVLQIYFSVGYTNYHYCLMFVGPCIIVITEE